MTKWVWSALLALALALVGLAGAVIAAQASTTSIQAAPASAFPGDSVTFTAKFTSSCPGALTTHYFTIDGKVYNGKLAQTGQAGTETLPMPALAVGAHSIRYDWKIQGTICRGFGTMTYTVAPFPSPSPSPPPSPSPSSSPPTPSPTPVVLVAAKGDGPLGYLGGALIVLALLSGFALTMLSRR